MLQVVFDTVLRMSIQGAIIFAIIFALRLGLKKLHILHKYIVLLWMILFFYLIFPWKIEMPIGFWNYDVSVETLADGQRIHGGNDEVKTPLPQNGVNIIADADNLGLKDFSEAFESVDVNLQEAQEVVTQQPGNEPVINEKEIEENDFSYESALDVASYIWFAVCLAFVVYFVISYILMQRKLVIREHMQDNVYWAQDIQIPMVFGVFRPEIFIPLHLDETKLMYVLAHERMHIRRKDYMVKILAYVVCMLHWFNPLVWVAYHLLGSDIEKACDEAVIRNLNEEKRKEYANALLMAAEGKLKGKRIFFAAPVCFDEGSVKGRIKNITKYKYTLPIVGALIVVIALALAVVFMTRTASEAEISKDEIVAGDTNESGEKADNVEEASEFDAASYYLDTETMCRVGFTDILGYDGYFITDKRERLQTTTYYAVEGNETFKIAISRYLDRKDYAVDIDGDGIKELICNVLEEGGGQEVIIYRRVGEQIELAYGSELLKEEYDDIGVFSKIAIYDAVYEEIDIHYWNNELQDYKVASYKIDLEQIPYWMEPGDFQWMGCVLKTMDFIAEDGTEYVFEAVGKKSETSSLYGIKQIDVYADGDLIQTIMLQDAIDSDGADGIEKGYTECWDKISVMDLKDINFDGYPDIEVFAWVPNNSIPYYYYCWNKDTNQYEYAFCSQITELDAVREQLVSWYEVENGLYYKDYYVVNEAYELELIERQIEDARPEETIEAARIDAYVSALEGIYYEGYFPDGRECDGEAAGNYFAIFDIDKDGREELIIHYVNDVIAGMTERIYDYDEEAGTLYEEFSAFPDCTFYDNGVIHAGASHNHGMASATDNFWPYGLYQYDAESDTYLEIAYVDAWDIANGEESGDGHIYPKEADLDGDGRVYYLMPGEYILENPIDNAEYEQWRASFYENTSVVKIPYMEITIENINNLK